MAHNTRIFPDVIYVNGAPIPSSYFQALDTAQSKAVNGDAGGSWVPASAINIGGAGLWFGARWSLSGGAQIRTPFDFGFGSRFTHGSDDWFQLESGHLHNSRNRVTPLGIAVDASMMATTTALGPVPILSFMARASYGAFQDGQRCANYGARIIAPLAVHHLATFASCTLYMQVSVAHSGSASAPSSLPMMRVMAVDALGNVTILNTNAASAGWVGAGFVQYPPQASGNFWYNGGLAQSLVYTIDAGTIVDTTKYSYFIEVIDENGDPSTGNCFPGNYFLSAVSLMTSIADLRPQ